MIYMIHIHITATIIIQTSPHTSRISIIDNGGLLSLFDFEATPGEGAGVSGTGGEGKHQKLDRKDVWDMKWAAVSTSSDALMSALALLDYYVRRVNIVIA